MSISIGDVRELDCRFCKSRTSHVACLFFEKETHIALFEFQCSKCRRRLPIARVPPQFFKDAQKLVNLRIPDQKPPR